MATVGEIVYLGRDNTIDLILSADGVVQSLTSVSRIDLIDVGCSFEITSEDYPGAFDWSTNPAAGVLILHLSDIDIPVGYYTCKLVVYDPTNTQGIVWGCINLLVKADCNIV